MSIVQRLRDTYNRLDHDEIEAGKLAKLYADDVVFVDPLHRIEGLPALQRYMLGMYQNVNDVSFRYLTTWETENQAMLRWEMDFSHPRLNRGQLITLPGVTYVESADKITWHQDYFDSNQMIFDHTPLLGSLLGWLKGRLN